MRQASCEAITVCTIVELRLQLQVVLDVRVVLARRCGDLEIPQQPHQLAQSLLHLAEMLHPAADDCLWILDFRPPSFLGITLQPAGGLRISDSTAICQT